MMTTMTGWRSNYWSVKIWVLRRSWFLIIGLLLLAVMVASVLQQARAKGGGQPNP